MENVPNQFALRKRLFRHICELTVHMEDLRDHFYVGSKLYHGGFSIFLTSCHDIHFTLLDVLFSPVSVVDLMFYLREPAK